MTNDTGAGRPVDAARFPPRGTSERAVVLRAAIGVGVATGAYGVSFGAVAES